MLRVSDLLSTLVVEATVHHLDLVAHVDLPGPSALSLAEVRRVLDLLAGTSWPQAMTDTEVALVGTGRAAAPSGLGALTDRLPLLR